MAALEPLTQSAGQTNPSTPANLTFISLWTNAEQTPIVQYPAPTEGILYPIGTETVLVE